MFASNPFAELATIIPINVIQGYVILMAILVVGGTVWDMIHKKSAQYFFAKAKAAEASRTRELGAGDKLGIAASTVAVDMITSGEFCNPNRRVSHLFTMYGFILLLLTTIALLFAYPTQEARGIVSQLWHLGAAMVMFGGYWFWFFIRVDVAAEGNPWYRVVRADLFVLSLLATATFALIWSFMQMVGASSLSTLFFALFILSSTVLFGGVLWSKFAHMFFKPAAAFQKRVAKADGSRDHLPAPADKPEQFGPGIKRLLPRNY